ncbi:MAG: ECF transporter S component [Clostridiales bacterium]|nr:ECF transporter S component [Clostridiales bacterium]
MKEEGNKIIDVETVVDRKDDGKKSSGVRSSVFSTRAMAGMAIFAALSYGVSFLEFSVFPTSAVFFLKLDFSNVFIMLAGFMYGPLAALFVGIIKELLCLIGSSTFGVGQIANAFVILVYVIPPSIVYLKYKGIKSVVLSLFVACVLQTVTALLVNRFITFPLYGMAEAFAPAFWLIVAFNVIKSVSVSLLTLLLYKRISYVFERINIR